MARIVGCDEVVGVCCLLRVDERMVELMNIAVDEPFRGRGIGSAMVAEAVRMAMAGGYSEIVLGTGTEDCARDQIRFYERCGFRRSGLRKEYFVEKYPNDPIYVNGVQMRDMQVLRMDL